MVTPKKIRSDSAQPKLNPPEQDLIDKLRIQPDDIAPYEEPVFTAKPANVRKKSAKNPWALVWGDM